MLKPYDLGVNPKVSDGRISFTLKENGGYVLELDDYHGLLYIFNNKPCPIEDAAAVTHYFGAGVHFPGKITLHSGDTVYVDRDAFVYGSVFADNAENIRIYGNGIFDDSAEERLCEHCYDAYTNGNIKLHDCRNVSVEGVGFVNSALWCVNLFHCFDVNIDGINVFGQWRYNTDGVDICNCQHVRLENSFVHSFDDAIVIKGVLPYADMDVRDIHVKNCVVWCDWGKGLELGVETECLEYDNITFEDCDILRGGNSAIDIGNGYTAHVHNVRFENIRIEMNGFDTPEQLQESLDMKYTRQGKTALPRVINIFNRRYDWSGSPYEKCVGGRVGERSAWVTDVLCKDITVYYDAGLPLKDGRPVLGVYVENYRAAEGARLENIRLENLVCNGRKIPESEIDFHYLNTEPIEYK
jgi:hypothetical protein